MIPIERDSEWAKQFAVKEQEFLLNRGMPAITPSGYTLQILAPKKGLRAFRFYPSRKKNNRNNGSR